MPTMCDRETIISDLLVWILGAVLQFVRGPWRDVVKMVTNYVAVFGILEHAQQIAGRGGHPGPPARLDDGRLMNGHGYQTSL